jgi:hypothetical protein
MAERQASSFAKSSNPPRVGCGRTVADGKKRKSNRLHTDIISERQLNEPGTMLCLVECQLWRPYKPRAIEGWQKGSDLITRKDIASFLNRRLRRFDVALVRPSELWRTTEFLGKQPVPGHARPARPAFACVFGPDNEATRFDFVVVMPSILRPTIVAALRSVFAQNFAGSVQILIGVDQPRGEMALIGDACRDRPPSHSVLVLDPGYSTSQRHGGLHPCWDGGVLRTVLGYLAASRRLAFLDDDNWWAPHHLASLARALDGHEWAWSQRWFVDPWTRRPIAEDIWESVGPGAGVFGGWVDPNCLAIDKLACESVLRWWSIPTRNSGTAWDADRNVFRILQQEFKGRSTGSASCYYALTENDEHYARRMALINGGRTPSPANSLATAAVGRTAP